MQFLQDKWTKIFCQLIFDVLRLKLFLRYYKATSLIRVLDMTSNSAYGK